MNLCAKIYLIGYIVYFSVGFSFLLTTRIELTEPRSNTTNFFLQKLTSFYNVSYLLCGMFSVYLSSLSYTYVELILLNIQNEGFVFISPAMFYAGFSSVWSPLTGINELIAVYNAWCYFMGGAFFFLAIFIFAFFTAFSYEYGVSEDLSPLKTFYFRLICMSISFAFFFAEAWI